MYKLKAYMGSGAILIFAFAIIQITAESAFCQIRIGGTTITLPEKTKVLKHDRPKTEQPRTGQPGNEPLKTTAGGQTTRLVRLEPTSKPIFLKDTIEIKTRTRETYWKLPNEREYTSWLPRVTFDVFYDDSAKLRYRAEWFNADGSAWFDEMLRYGFLSGDKTVQLQSDYPDNLFDSKAVTANGTYSVKITDTKTGELIFQGKFKVNKLLHFPGETKYKNHFVFYVDNDWTLPTGYAGYDFLGSNTSPIAISLWFKDRLTLGDFEARLYRNGQQMTSTDDGGNILSTAERVGDCQRFPDKCMYQLWQFRWDKLRFRNGEVTDYFLQSNPGIKFTNENPGEYTVRIFHRGVQVREAKFTIDAKGLIARNAFSDQIYLTDHKVAVPVKVLGTLDKWNAATWKTDMFYGNPLTGFDAP
jgi:hypothetical protein